MCVNSLEGKTPRKFGNLNKRDVNVTPGGLLDELGYPRAFPRPRTANLENASRIRSLLV
jgi:hypothetical protein